MGLLSGHESALAMLAGPELDWPQVLAFASRQNLLPLLYLRLKGWGLEDQAPPTLWGRLRDVYLDRASDSLVVQRQVHEALKLFHANEIPVIVLKGAFLAEGVYGAPAVRWINDLDVLCPANRLEQAVSVLTRNGYQAKKKFWVDVERGQSHELPTFYKPDSAPLELHWTLVLPTLPFVVDVEGLWGRSQPATVARVPVRTLAPEDLLLHLCIHGAVQHHLYSGARLLCDIAAVAEHYQSQLDWPALVSRASVWRADRSAFLLLSLASSLLQAPMPDEALAALGSVEPEIEIVTAALDLIFADHDLPAHFTPDLAAFASQGWLGKARIALQRAFVSPEEMARMYPVRPDSIRVFFYYPRRWWDMATKYFKSASALARHDPTMTSAADWMHWRSLQEKTLVDHLLYDKEK